MEDAKHVVENIENLNKHTIIELPTILTIISWNYRKTLCSFKETIQCNLRIILKAKNLAVKSDYAVFGILLPTRFCSILTWFRIALKFNAMPAAYSTLSVKP